MKNRINCDDDYDDDNDATVCNTKSPCPLYTVFTRVIHALFNQNFLSKFRVRDLCDETILRRSIMKLRYDNQ